MRWNRLLSGEGVRHNRTGSLEEPRLMTPTLKGASFGGAISANMKAPPGGWCSRWGLLFARFAGASHMNVITVSREYGAGGGEVARRLAEALGWELLDRELLHQAAAV